jgi:hypothetical protein
MSKIMRATLRLLAAICLLSFVARIAAEKPADAAPRVFFAILFWFCAAGFLDWHKKEEL